MRRKKRTFLWKSFSRNGKVLMFGVFTILLILITTLMYLSNGYQQEQIQRSYCGDFGIYGKSLTLMRDNTFRFSYHGCSQANSNVSGKWVKEKGIITLVPSQPDVHLDAQYKQVDNRLLPVNLSVDEGFIYCNDFSGPWQHDVEEEN